jgi:SAM-dependent methyltransferase
LAKNINDHDYAESVKKNNFLAINCKNCGYWHVHPTPTENEISSYYEKQYYENLGDNRSMTDKLNDPDGFYEIQYEDRLRRIEKVFPGKLPRSVIDIGAGYGDFLSFMKKNKWEVQGIEPSKHACQNIKDKSLNIKLLDIGNISDAEFKPAALITLNNVLEHLREPRKVLEIIKEKFLLPKGILSIIVPNDFSLLQGIVMKTTLKNNPDRQYYWLEPPAHLNYWSTGTIGGFLKKCGFKILYMSVDFPIDLFLLMGEDYVTDSSIGRRTHLKRVRFEKHIRETKKHEFKDSLYENFSKAGIGRNLQVICAASKDGRAA